MFHFCILFPVFVKKWQKIAKKQKGTAISGGPFQEKQIRLGFVFECDSIPECDRVVSCFVFRSDQDEITSELGPLYLWHLLHLLGLITKIRIIIVSHYFSSFLYQKYCGMARLVSKASKSVPLTIVAAWFPKPRTNIPSGLFSANFSAV